MGETTNASGGQRYHQLDSLRGVAALFVFFGHSASMFAGAYWQTAAWNIFRATPLGLFFNGTLLVMFFFVLSGFVLSLPFVNSNKPLKLTEFYTKRVFRIYPAFIFALVLSLLFKHFLFNSAGMAHYPQVINYWNWHWDRDKLHEVFHTALLIGPDFHINLLDPPIWSLVIEMKVSMLLPFFIMIVSRGSVALNISFLVVITYLTYGHTSWAIPIFYSGVLLAKYKDQITTQMSGWSIGAISLFTIAAVLLCNIMYELTPLINVLAPGTNIWIKYLSSAGAGMLMMIVLSRPAVSRFFEQRGFTFFGEISYSLYLVHMPVMITIGSIINNLSSGSRLLLFLPCLALVVGISYVMLVLIERPFQKFAKNLCKRYKLFSAVGI